MILLAIVNAYLLLQEYNMLTNPYISIFTNVCYHTSRMQKKFFVLKVGQNLYQNCDLPRQTGIIHAYVCEYDIVSSIDNEVVIKT